MLKSSIAGLITLSVLALPAGADTEFEDSIPIEVAEVLFDASLNGQFEIYSDIADAFPPFELPDNFTVIGSTVQNGNLRAVVSSAMASDAAIQQLIAAFEVEDWQQLPAFNPPAQDTGFVAPGPITVRTANSLCHDDLGRLSISAAERGAINYFAIFMYNAFGGSQGSCASQIARQQQSMAQMQFSDGVRQYMPRMEVPEAENIRPRGAFIGGGSSSSNNSAETETNLRSDLDIEELYKHFAEQILEQGWEIDSEVVGDRSANGTWTRAPEPNLELVGTLSVLETSDSNYELRFRLRAEGDPGNLGLFLR